MTSLGNFEAHVAMNGDGWDAEVLLSKTGEWVSVYARVNGTSKIAAQRGAQTVYRTYAKSRDVVIRVAPTSTTEHLFDYQQTVHHGYVRFSYRHGASRIRRPSSRFVDTLVALP